MQPLSEPQGAVRAMTDTIQQLMGIANTKPRIDDETLIGTAIAIRVLQVKELIIVSLKDTAATKIYTLDHGQPLYIARRLIRLAVSIRIF